MSHDVNAAMDPMQSTGLGGLRGRIPSVSQLGKLPGRDHPVLTSREFG
jgi:hypothetical protein